MTTPMPTGPPRTVPIPAGDITLRDARSGQSRVVSLRSFEIGEPPPNAFGLHDTLGNVWEWCWDFADTARYLDYRTLRGGGFADREWSVRASVRRACAPDGVPPDAGFRVARGAVAASGEAAAQGWSAGADRRRADVRGPLPVGWTPHRALLG